MKLKYSFGNFSPNLWLLNMCRFRSSIYLFLSLLVFGLTGCPNSGEKKLSSSYWPSFSSDEKLNKKMVITNVNNIDAYEPLPTIGIMDFSPPFTNYELGNSISSATGNVMGKLAIYESRPDEITVQNKGKVSYDFKLVKSYSDLFKSSSLSAGLSVQYYGFRGSARYETANELKISKYHEYIAAKVSVIDRIESLKHMKITDEAKNYTSDKQLFISKFGDQILSGRVMGGELIVLIEIESSSASEQSSNKVHIDAAFKAIGTKVSTSADIASAIAELQQTSRYSIRYIKNGTIANVAEKNTQVSSIMSIIDSFPASVHNDGEAIEYKTSSIFSGLEDLPKNFEASDFGIILTQRQYLDAIEGSLNSCMATLPDLQYILNNSESFKAPDVKKAKTVYSRNFKVMKAFESNWRICATVPQLCKECVKLKYTPETFSPNPDVKNHVIEKKEIELAINNPNYQDLITIPANLACNLNITGKVQYNHIGPRECRTPSWSLEELSQSGWEYERGDGVHAAMKLLPFITFQLFELVDGKQIAYQNEFNYTGKPINLTSNPRELILKYRMNLEWVTGHPTIPYSLIVSPERNVDSKEFHIANHIFSCGDSKLKALVEL